MIKKTFYLIIALLVSLILTGCAIYNFAPQFGAAIDHSASNDEYRFSDNFTNNKFVNQVPTQLNQDLSKTWELIVKFIEGVPNDAPTQNIDVIRHQQLPTDLKETKLMWFGHSSFLLQMEGVNLFFDPVFAEVASPFKWLGSPRYNNQHPVDIPDLPKIDAVVISHDHYDHLDHESIVKMDHKVDKYLVPLAVSKHLIHWGINKNKIVELDWWQDTKVSDLTITFTPSRHFSGRRFEQNNTLWGGWYINSANESFFYSGDSGYGPHFKEIQQRLGDVDYALLECGQYNQDWADIHMMPEQTVTAAKDLNANIMMPIHWGTFTLAFHSWTDPVERAVAEANKQHQTIITPQIGEYVTLLEEPKKREQWWLQYLN